MTRSMPIRYLALVTLGVLMGAIEQSSAETPSKILDSIPEGSIAENRNPIPMERKLSKLRTVTTPSLEQSRDLRGLPRIVQGNIGDQSSPPGSIPVQVDVRPENYGTGNISTINHYTDNLVLNPNVFPYRPTGWFRFSNYAGASMRCTAALIAPSIIVTAGHCVHKGGGGAPYWNKSGSFTPAYDSGTAPYGSAIVDSLYTTSGWFNYGSLDKGYDVALVVLKKKTGTTSQIGTATGWYGFCYSSCLQTYWHNTQLGYPGNYYSGAKMTQGEHLEYSDGFDYRSGSGMEGGSSGGPHLANLGSISDSSTNLGAYTSRNVVFAVTSWGYISSSIKIQGYSPLSGPNNSNNFVSMWNAACARARLLHGSTACALL